MKTLVSMVRGLYKRNNHKPLVVVDANYFISLHKSDLLDCKNHKICLLKNLKNQ